MWRGDLAELHRVDRRQAEVDHAWPEPVLARARVLLQIAEPRERRDVAVRGAAGQPEAPCELADPQLGRRRLERGENREPALERLGLTRSGRDALARRHDP